MPAIPQPPTSSAFDLEGRPNSVWTRWFLQVFSRVGGSVGDTVPEVSAAVAALQAGIPTIDDRITALESGTVLPSFTVADLPAAAGNAGKMVFVANESGGAVPAFSDGTSWRRVTDRAVVS